MDDACHMFNEIKAHSTVISEPVPVLPEGVNRRLHRVATSRMAKKRASAPLLTCKVCTITVTGTHQLRQHKGGKKHLPRQARYQRKAEDHYCTTCKRGFPSAHDLASHLIGVNHRRRVLYLQDREFNAQ